MGMTAILGSPLSPKFNVYDIRKQCDNPPLCYDFSLADRFLNQDSVRELLGVKNRKWVECSRLVHSFMLKDWTSNMAEKVATILEKGV